MKYVFWVLLILFGLFLYLTIHTKRKKGKLKARFLIPTALFLIPCVLLSGVAVVYHTQVKPSPSTSTILLENTEFRIGHASKAQPESLDEYIAAVAPQIGFFNEHASDFWPDSSFEDAVVYFITSDKKQAWKIEHDGTYYTVDDVKTVPQYSSVSGYSTEFIPLYEASDGEKGVLLVISRDEMRDQQSHERYTHVGMYDPIITYIHEGFHLFTQGNDHWIEETSDTDRSDALDNLEARKLRTHMIDLLYKAMQNETSRDLYVKQAIRVFNEYKEMFPDEYAGIRYFDKIEGSAYYFEVVACLQSCYPETINADNYLDAAALWTTNRQAQNMAGAGSEAYELGALAGVLLDIYSDNADTWKLDLQANPQATPMELLSTLYSEEEIEQTEMPEISEGFIDALTAKIEEGQNVQNGMIDLIYHLFF